MVVVGALAVVGAAVLVAYDNRVRSTTCTGVGVFGPSANSADDALRAYIAGPAPRPGATLAPFDEWQGTETRPGTIEYRGPDGARLEVYERPASSWSVGSSSTCR